MRKFTLFMMSLFLSVGAMAQNYEFELIDLKSNADQMLYSNAPCTVTTWGDDFKGWHVLFDDNANTIFHSEYGSGTSVDGLDHYLRVDMGENNELSTFKFTFTTRDKNCEVNSPTTIVVEGSNESNGTYTVIKTITGIPQQNSYKYESDVLGQTGVAYRYIRFRVTATGSNQTDGGGKKFFFIAEFGMSKATPAARTEYVHNTGSMNRNPGEERGLTTFTLTDGTNSLTVSNIQDASSRTAPVYVDKSSVKFTTTQGATLKFTDFSYTGAWMHAYAYVDYNKDYGFTLTSNNAGTNDGEIVSYNYYDGKTITGTTGSQSDAMTSEHNGSKTLPAFTLPSNLEPGEYRMRIKVDWNNLDADYGASDIAANGGAQCDITLVVEEAVGNEIAWNALNNAVDEALALFGAVNIGTSVGSYSSSIDGYEAEFEGIRSYLSGITEETPSDEIDAKTARVREIIASFSLNMPKNGEYFRVAYDYGGTVGKLYLQGLDSEQEKPNQLSFPAKFAAESGAESIWYYYDGALYSYTAGRCLNEAGNNRGLYNVGEKVDATFTASTRAAGKYNIACTSYIHANVTDTNYYTDHCSDNNNNHNNHDLILEPVTELPVSISAAGKATFFAPVAVEVPSGVKAYTVTINGEWATLNEITTGVIPAEIGVVLEGAQNTYDFAITTTEATATSDLRGSAATTYYTEAGTYYALGMVAGVVAFYRDEFNNSRFQNNSHKAYLYVAGTNNAASYSFRFGEGTTGIEEVEISNEKEEIFDLTGRKIDTITKAGIYIVGGKKVLVK